VQNEKRWYVVEAFHGEDELAYLRLAAVFVNTDLTVWRPVDVERCPDRRARSSGKPRRDRRRPRFGRFIFLRANLSDSLYHAVKNATHVRGFLTYAGSFEPASLPDKLVEFYRQEIPRRMKLPDGLAIGATVRINDGPFIGLRGPVEALVDTGVVTVSVQLFGRLTPLPIEVGHVSVEVTELAKPPSSRTSRKVAIKQAPSAKLCPKLETKALVSA
jgi:transcription antitermination factor NusG